MVLPEIISHVQVSEAKSEDNWYSHTYTPNFRLCIILCQLILYYFCLLVTIRDKGPFEKQAPRRMKWICLLIMRSPMWQLTLFGGITPKMLTE